MQKFGLFQTEYNKDKVVEADKEVAIFVFDTLKQNKNEGGGIYISEIQSFGSSELSPVVAENLLRSLNVEGMSFIGNEVTFSDVDPTAFLPETYQSTKPLQHLRMTSHPTFNNANVVNGHLLVATKNTVPNQLDTLTARAKYYETTDLRGNPTQLLVSNKFIQRYLLNKICPKANPKQYKLYNTDVSPYPTLKELNETFPEGWIIKPVDSTRSKGVSINKFKDDEEFKKFLKDNSMKKFLVESFVKATIEAEVQNEKKAFQATHRLVYLLKDGKVSLLGIQVDAAIKSLSDKNQTRSTNDTAICDGRNGETSRKLYDLKEYQEVFGADDPLLLPDNQFTVIVNAVKNTNVHSLLKDILINGTLDEQKYVLDKIGYSIADRAVKAEFIQNHRNFIKDLLLDTQTKDRVENHLREYDPEFLKTLKYEMEANKNGRAIDDLPFFAGEVSNIEEAHDLAGKILIQNENGEIVNDSKHHHMVLVRVKHNDWDVSYFGCSKYAAEYAYPLKEDFISTHQLSDPWDVISLFQSPHNLIEYDIKAAKANENRSQLSLSMSQ